MMAESPMVGARVPLEWQKHLREIARTTGRTEADVVRAALAQYLGQTDPTAVKSALVDHEERITRLELKLASLLRLVG